MIRRAAEEILYPSEPEIKMVKNGNTKLPAVFVTPRKSWNYVCNDLDSIFRNIGDCKPSNIFVFSKLRNGKIGFEDSFTIYTDSDCPVEHVLLTKNDDVCSEEFGAEILLPYLDRYFPSVPVNQFLSPENRPENRDFFDYVCKNYKNALIFISRNDSEDPLWPESLQD